MHAVASIPPIDPPDDWDNADPSLRCAIIQSLGPVALLMNQRTVAAIGFFVAEALFEPSWLPSKLSAGNNVNVGASLAAESSCA